MIPLTRLLRWLSARPTKCDQCHEPLTAGADRFCGEECEYDYVSQTNW